MKRRLAHLALLITLSSFVIPGSRPLAAPPPQTGRPSASAKADADAYAVLGQKYLNADDNAKAAAAFKKAVSLDPTLAAAYYGLGVAYHQQKQYQLAVPAYKRYLAMRPSDALAFIVLGNAERELKQYGDAAEAFRSAIRLKPATKNLVNAHYGLGVTYVLMGKKEEAVQVYKALQTLDPKTAQQLLDEINKMK